MVFRRDKILIKFLSTFSTVTYCSNSSSPPILTFMETELIPQYIKDMHQDIKKLMSAFGCMQEDISGLKIDVAQLKTDVSELKTDVAQLKTDVTELKVDVSELRTDVSELKSDVAEMKIDISELKTDVAQLKVDMSEMKLRVTALEVDVSDLKELTQHILKHMVTQDQFESLNKDVLHIKKDNNEIMKYIGLYEVRSQNLEDVIFHDHKPRIVDLEKAVYN